MQAEPVDDGLEYTSVDQLTIQQVEDLLSEVRVKRLQRVKQLEALAKVKADDNNLEVAIKFNRLMTRIKGKLIDLQEDEELVQQLINKARALAMDMEAF